MLYENEGKEIEVVDAENEGVENAVLPPEKKNISYGILAPWTKMMEETIGAPWDRSTWLLVYMPSTMSWRPISKLSMLSPHFLYPLHQPTSALTIPYLPNIVLNRDSNFKKGESGVQKWLQQFHDRRVVKKKKPQYLSYEQEQKDTGIPNIPKT